MPATKIKGLRTVARRRDGPYRTVKHTIPGGHAYHSKEASTIRFWDETAMVEVTIDVDVLFVMMADRAIHTKGGKATLADGIVTAKVLSRQEMNVRDEPQPLREGSTLVVKS